jgi:DNA-binding GntR family transcriptional regulator
MQPSSAKTSLGYRPLPQLIAESLRERIMSGTYAPGARLSVAEIARDLGVSAIPVREALRNLEALGLISFEPNRGATVRSLTSAEVRELTLIRTPLEVLAATEAMQRATPEALAELETVLESMDEKPAEWIPLHDRFHTSIHRLSGLPLLCEWLAMLRDRMRPYILIYLNDNEQRAIAQAEHHQYVDGLRRRDAALLQSLVPRHLARSAQVGGFWPVDPVHQVSSSTAKRPGRPRM